MTSNNNHDALNQVQGFGILGKISNIQNQNINSHSFKAYTYMTDTPSKALDLNKIV